MNTQLRSRDWHNPTATKRYYRRNVPYFGSKAFFTGGRVLSSVQGSNDSVVAGNPNDNLITTLGLTNDDPVTVQFLWIPDIPFNPAIGNWHIFQLNGAPNNVTYEMPYIELYFKQSAGDNRLHLRWRTSSQLSGYRKQEVSFGNPFPLSVPLTFKITVNTNGTNCRLMVDQNDGNGLTTLMNSAGDGVVEADRTDPDWGIVLQTTQDWLQANWASFAAGVTDTTVPAPGAYQGQYAYIQVAPVNDIVEANLAASDITWEAHPGEQWFNSMPYGFKINGSALVEPPNMYVGKIPFDPAAMTNPHTIRSSAEFHLEKAYRNGLFVGMHPFGYVGDYEPDAFKQGDID